MNSSTADGAPIVIIGAGLAGLTVALHLADRNPVVMLAKRGLEEGATPQAQGGIVGVLGADDSVELHVRDTQVAGAGLVDEHAARFIAERSAAAVEWLLDQGVPFTTDPNGPLGLHLTREGGHAVRRIAHAADATGQAIHEVLLAKAAALGCDLVIKGAYTQSRLRQMIFGGVTRHILAATQLPVLMAH